MQRLVTSAPGFRKEESPLLAGSLLYDESAISCEWSDACRASKGGYLVAFSSLLA